MANMWQPSSETTPIILLGKVLIERMKEEREKRQLEAKRKRIYQQKMAEREAKLAEREWLAQEKARRAEERQARIKAQEEFQRKRDLAAKMNLNMNDQQLKELHLPRASQAAPAGGD